MNSAGHLLSLRKAKLLKFPVRSLSVKSSVSEYRGLTIVLSDSNNMILRLAQTNFNDCGAELNVSYSNTSHNMKRGDKHL